MPRRSSPRFKLSSTRSALPGGACDEGGTPLSGSGGAPPGGENGKHPPPNNVNRALFSTTGVKRDPPSLPKFADATHINIGDGSNDGPKKKKVRVAAGTSSKGGIQPQMGDGTDDKDVDYLPITNAAGNKEVDGWTGHVSDHTMSEKHRQAFMALAFPPDDDKEYENSQAKSASIPTCRSKKEYEYIKYVVRNWEKGTNIRQMGQGEHRDRLLQFRQQHRNGQKYKDQYFLENILPPGQTEPRKVLRRYEHAIKHDKTSPMIEGRIVTCEEDLFDAIDEWHSANGHLGFERTWTYCQEKYWNVTQDHVDFFCKTCHACSKSNPATKKLTGSIKPIFSKGRMA